MADVSGMQQKKNNSTFYDLSYVAVSELTDLLWTFYKMQGRIACRVGVTLWEG